MKKVLKIILATLAVFAFICLVGYVVSLIMQVFTSPINYIIMACSLALLVFGIVFSLFRNHQTGYVLEKICPECGESLYLTYDAPEDETELRIYYYQCEKCDYVELITKELNH